MRVNLIGNFKPNTGLTHDAMIMRGLLTAVYGEIQIRNVHHIFPQCEEAEINIFLEVINPSLFSYASRNIWIPNIEWTNKNWIPYLSMVEVWVKTREAEVVFSEFCKPTYIGWTSIDKVYSEKKYSKAIVLVGKNIFRNPKPILQAYARIKATDSKLYAKLPVLHIPYNPEFVNFFNPQLDKVELLDKVLSESAYDELLHECGLAICTSAAEGFGHAVNEAMSTGCNLLLSPIVPFQELTEKALWLTTSNTIDHPSCLGKLVDVSVASIIEKLKVYVDTTTKTKKAISLAVRSAYEARHAKFVELMKGMFPVMPEYVLADTLPKEDELPCVSIITLTYNRRIFMPLAKYSYMIQSYPEDKLEWVIVDDGDDPIEDTLIGISNVKYVRSEEKLTIGAKRNLGVQSAMYDVIVMMDDDDVYPNNSVLHRVAMLSKSPAKECGFCTTIPCYDIEKYSSFMNVPPNTLPMAERVSEASLVFTRKFWEDRKFPEIQVAEANAFIHGREQMCRELSPQEVIVSLVHSKNTSSRKIPEGEPNGCHYGFNEQLFDVVSVIGETLRSEKDGGGASCGTCDGDRPSPQAPPPHQHHACEDPSSQASPLPSSS